MSDVLLLSDFLLHLEKVPRTTLASASRRYLMIFLLYKLAANLVLDMFDQQHQAFADHFLIRSAVDQPRQHFILRTLGIEPRVAESGSKHAYH